jgi:antitoxin YefM
MKAITYSNARQNLAKTIENVINDHDPVIITKKGDEAVVMLSMEDYESMQETAYLMRSKVNARILMDSIDELESGGGTEHETIKCD